MHPILPKKDMTEEDIKLQYITPAVTSKWSRGKITMETQITDGKINLRGNMVFREKPKRADYLLYLSANNPIAVIEAKDNNHTVSTAYSRRWSTPGCWTCPLRSVPMETALPSTTFSPAQSGNSAWMNSPQRRN